jgi:hypothetical protein
VNDEDAKSINSMVEDMGERPKAPALTPAQLNAIDLLCTGQTQAQAADAVGVTRVTVTRWYANPFFVAELNQRRELIWQDAKLRLKSLAGEAVDTLVRSLHSTDEKVALSSAIHVLKSLGFFERGEVSSVTGPKTPEEACYKQVWEERLRIYRGIRPDAAKDWQTENFTEKLASKDAPEWIAYHYEEAVRAQRKELREAKKETQPEPVPLRLEPAEEREGEDRAVMQDPLSA